MAKTILVLMYVAFVLAAGSKNETINPARVAANRLAVDACQKYQCVGGFVVLHGSGEILYIRHGGEQPLSSIYVTDLLNGVKLQGDAYLNKFDKIIPPSDPQWKKYAIKYVEQFVPTKRPNKAAYKAPMT
ncbi:MAG: hypothetical protein ACHQU0_00755 [Candidatus Paceibacteria bacterium]